MLPVLLTRKFDERGDVNEDGRGADHRWEVKATMAAAFWT